MFSSPLFINLYRRPLQVSGMESNSSCIDHVSPFFLFEATGDSEAAAAADHPPPLAADAAAAAAAVSTSVGVGFNDAESCTSDDPPHDDLLQDDGQGWEVEEEEEEGEGEVEDESGEVFDSSSSSEVGLFPKSRASPDSTMEFKRLNEMDKNKLFWEACLAS